MQLFTNVHQSSDLILHIVSVHEGPFEDALKLHEACGGAIGSTGIQVLEDQWPSPPRRRAPVAPNEEQLRRETWYHSRMSRRDAERLLVRDGDFLVRESTTNPGQYVLTGMHCGLPKHLLLVDPEGVVSFFLHQHQLLYYRQTHDARVLGKSKIIFENP